MISTHHLGLFKRLRLAGYISRDRLNGILGVTRAFGDISFKEYPPAQDGGLWRGQQLTSQPETTAVNDALYA